MGWFNPGNIFIFAVSIEPIWKNIAMDDSMYCFFITKKYHKAKHSGYIFLLSTLIPYISIDMSYFYKNNKKEKVSWED